MNYFDVLFAKKQSGGGETPILISKSITANGTYSASADNADGYSQVTVAVDGFKKKSIANTPTDIASFDDGTANPMPSLEISINPVQSGSGDPSPSNVRPISGWSGCNVSRTGKNLLPSVFSSYSTNDNYAFMNGIVPNGETARFTFTDKDTSVDISGCCIGFQNGLSEQVSTTGTFRWAINNGVVQINKSNISGNNVICNGVMLYPKDQTTFDKLFARYDIMVELGSTETSYEPYQGLTTTIPFHDSSDNPITVYGGTLNVTSGELRVTHANIASYNSETINEPWISSMDAYSAGATPTTGAQVVYPLATPQTYQLTPAQVTTLLSQNNIFADCGQILEGEYFVTL